MTRIIGGRHRGRRLRTPPGVATRPTADRVREALFSSLEAQLGGLEGLRFLDLYAGSGAVGLEAASRGAAAVVAVESHRRTARVVEANARDLGADQVRVVTASVPTHLATEPPEPYDVVFADPPYALPEPALGADLAALIARGWLAEEALVVLERSARGPEPTWPEGLGRPLRREYGETVLWYVHAA